MRKITAVTVARSDYGIYRPILRKIQECPDLSLSLIVSGMHLSPEFGLTVQAIEADGFPITERVETLLSSDTPVGISTTMGLGAISFAQAYARARPDLLLVLGDRFDMFAAALAALPFRIPVAHIHGGEVTLGAIDDALRHSITKLSHLHFATTAKHGQRICQMGEEAWRVVVCGAPSLDNLRSVPLLQPSELESRFGLSLRKPPLLVTFHPVTLEFEQTGFQTDELLAALERSGLPIVFTQPNADTNGRLASRMMADYVASHPHTFLVDNLGTQAYFSLMKYALAMVGNSSSGIIEAASFELPVVNIGTRQDGRVRAANVIDVGYGRNEIHDGIVRAVKPAFRSELRGLVNPYGDGTASDKIVRMLREVTLDSRLTLKRFCDLAA